MEVYLKYLVDHEEDRQLLIDYGIGDIYCFDAIKQLDTAKWFSLYSNSEGFIFNKNMEGWHSLTIRLNSNKRMYSVFLRRAYILDNISPDLNGDYVYTSKQIEYFETQLEELNNFLEIIQ